MHKGIKINAYILKVRGDFMFMTVKEVAQLLRISERHTYKLLQKNVIPHTKIGRKILVNKERLLETLEKKEVK